MFARFVFYFEFEKVPSKISIMLGRLLLTTRIRAPNQAYRALTTRPHLHCEIITKKITHNGTETTSSPSYEGSTIVLLHGILGSGQNLRSFARRVANEHPGSKCVLVDLRAHGESPSYYGDGTGPPATVDKCADDVKRLLSSMKLSPEVLWGHSFGGKVVLSMLEKRDDKARRADDATTENCRSAWIIDSQPGLVDTKGWGNNENPNSVERIIDVLSTLVPPFESKDDLMLQINEKGVDRMIQTWMTTNVARDAATGKFHWKFQMDVVKELFTDYCSKDM